MGRLQHEHQPRLVPPVLAPPSPASLLLSPPAPLGSAPASWRTRPAQRGHQLEQEQSPAPLSSVDRVDGEILARLPPLLDSPSLPTRLLCPSLSPCPLFRAPATDAPPVFPLVRPSQTPTRRSWSSRPRSSAATRRTLRRRPTGGASLVSPSLAPGRPGAEPAHPPSRLCSRRNYPVYTVLLDKHFDGVPANNDHFGTLFEWSNTETQVRHGGDITGMINDRSLDYLQLMGVKAIYVAGTPFLCVLLLSWAARARCGLGAVAALARRAGADPPPPFLAPSAALPCSNMPWQADGYSALDFTLSASVPTCGPPAQPLTSPRLPLRTPLRSRPPLGHGPGVGRRDPEPARPRHVLLCRPDDRDDGQYDRPDGPHERLCAVQHRRVQGRVEPRALRSLEPRASFYPASVERYPGRR